MDRRSRGWRAFSGEWKPNEAGQAGSPEETGTPEGPAFRYELEPRCKLCSAADPASELPDGEAVLRTVDSLAVKGATHASILEAIGPMVREWPEADRPHYSSVRRHVQRHLGADAAAVREILERRAAQADVQTAVKGGRIVTHGALLEVIRDKGFEALASGAVAPSVREAVDAAQALDELERDDTAERLREAMEQFRRFATIVRRSVSEEHWEEMIRELEGEGGASPLVLPAAGGPDTAASGTTRPPEGPDTDGPGRPGGNTQNSEGSEELEEGEVG
jgi:hypothetical protein